MMQTFTETAALLENRFVQEWKRSGKKVVGYTCSYLPDEVFHAAGILPFRLRGTGAGSTSIGDSYFGPFICSFPKCLLQLAGEGKYHFLDGAIITPGCDSMRRLDECWRKAGSDASEALPGFFFYYGVPHKNTGYSREWFTGETRLLIEAVEKHFNVRVTDDALSASIRLYNKSRTLLNALDELRTTDPSPVSGADALATVISATAMPREEYASLLEQLIASLKSGGTGVRGGPRLMLVGSANDDVELVRLIEGEKATVVADNLCFGPRFQADLVDETGDPVAALAAHSLAHNECPRMFGDYKARLSLLKRKIERAHVDGVILQNIRFCDLHGSENGIFERDLEAAGIPCIRIEREYGPLIETGRVKMRLDAFLERIVARRKPA